MTNFAFIPRIYSYLMIYIQNINQLYKYQNILYPNTIITDKQQVLHIPWQMDHDGHDTCYDHRFHLPICGQAKPNCTFKVGVKHQLLLPNPCVSF